MPQFKKFEYPLMIKEHHLDTFGHVNHATYIALLEEARWDILNQHGFGLKTIQETQLGPVVLACNVNFLKEVRVREQLIVQTQVLEYQKKIGLIEHHMIGEQDKLCLKATITFGFFDLKKRKLVLPTESWLLALGQQVVKDDNP